MHIGRYRITGRLGSGGMGVVYKARMPRTGKIVALKLCRPAEILLDTMGAEGVREFFLREAVAMASVRHENVAPILDVDEAELPGMGRTPFFTMEYYCLSLGQLMGEDYDPARASRALPAGDAFSFAAQMCEGLSCMHFSGLVHRDVKPFNVLLTDEEQVKLIDLGLSRLRGEPEKRPRGMVVGSPFYTAPEQEQDPDSADERADLFSVGVSLFRMLTGRLPEDDEGGRVRASEVLPTADPALGEVGRELDELLERAMHPDPARRHQTARELADEITLLAERYERARSSACTLLELEDPIPEQEGSLRAVPRAEPKKIPLAHAAEVFGLDEHFRPKPQSGDDFAPRGECCVAGTGAKLLWQRSGSPFPLTRNEAQQYVENLNETRYADREDWRLPTVEELCTVLRPGAGAHCADSRFDQTQQRLWSADAKSFTAHWYADARRGFVWWQDDTCRFHVRAVCPLEGGPDEEGPEPTEGN